MPLSRTISNSAPVPLPRASAPRTLLSSFSLPPSDRRLVYFVMLCCAGLLYLQTFRLPCIPRFATGDQSIYLEDAARMFNGQTIYRDFDHFTFPGTSGLYDFLFRIFGVKEWIPQAMLIVLGTLIAWLTWRISRAFLTGFSVFLPPLLFLALPFTGYLDATHHWYSTLAATAALAVLIDERTPLRLACAGLLWAVATTFAQSMIVGPLALGAFLVWEAVRRREALVSFLRRQAFLFIAYATTLVTLNGYAVWKVGFSRFWAETVSFVLKYYPADRFNSWGAYFASRPSRHELLHSPQTWIDLPAWFLIHLLLPLIYVLFFFAYRKICQRHDERTRERLVLVAVTGISMLLVVASAAATQRLYTVSVPALILLVSLVELLPFTRRRLVLNGLWILIVSLAILKPLMTQIELSRRLVLPTGSTSFERGAPYEKAEWLLQRTMPRDYFFGDPAVAFALRLRNPARVDFVRFTDYTRPEQVADLIRGLEAHKVKFVSWYPGLDSATAGRRGDHLAPLRDYLRTHYCVAAQFSNGDKLWQRTGP